MIALALACSAAACSPCLDESGCAAARALAACDAGPAPVAIAEIGAHEGSEVRVAGTLAMDAGRCTQLGCSHGCCNSCGASLAVAAAPEGPQVVVRDSTGQELTCGGDESLICCPHRLGQAVTASGRVVRAGATGDGPVFELHDATLCAD